MPIPQLLHEMQPDAKLIITLTDPVARMYSDYYFLTDHGVTLNDPEGLSDKSPLEFEAIVRQQVTAFEECLESFGGPESARLDMAVGVKGAEVLTEGAARCAYDRDAFGRPGSGRMATGLYAVYLERWLAAGFPLESVLVLRLEDFNKDPQAHMQVSAPPLPPLLAPAAAHPPIPHSAYSRTSTWARRTRASGNGSSGTRTGRTRSHTSGPT